MARTFPPSLGRHPQHHRAALAAYYARPTMAITHIDHIYAETRSWDAGVSFWNGLGFVFAEQWGSEGHRAGRLVAGDASVVLAEITEGEPAFHVFFGLADGDHFEMGRGVDVVTPLSDTHWGTRWIRVRDDEDRVHALEETT